MIKLIDVEKSYESGAGKTWVLRRINLEIGEGGFITIMGPSGAGKSTLMGIIGMLDGEWRGKYFLADRAVHKLDSRRRAELNKQYIGFVFQQYHLLDNLTVAENLDLPLSYRAVKKSERQALVADALWIDFRSWERNRYAQTNFRAASNSSWQSRAPSSQNRN